MAEACLLCRRRAISPSWLAEQPELVHFIVPHYPGSHCQNSKAEPSRLLTDLSNRRRVQLLVMAPLIHVQTGVIACSVGTTCSNIRSQCCAMKGNRASGSKVQPGIQSFFSSKPRKGSNASTGEGGTGKNEKHETSPEQRKALDPSGQEENKAPATADQIKRSRPEDDVVVVEDSEPSIKRPRESQPRQAVARDPMRHELAKRKFAMKRQKLVQDKTVPMPSKASKFTPLEQQARMLHGCCVCCAACSALFQPSHM